MSDESVKLDIRQRSSPLVVSDVSSKISVNEADKLEDKKLLKKIDWRIVPWIFCLYFLSVEDRSNVGFAMTMNKDVNHTLADTSGLTPRENNIGLGLFYVAYIVCRYFKEIKACILLTELLSFLKYPPI